MAEAKLKALRRCAPCASRAVDQGGRGRASASRCRAETKERQLRRMSRSVDYINLQVSESDPCHGWGGRASESGRNALATAAGRIESGAESVWGVYSASCRQISKMPSLLARVQRHHALSPQRKFFHLRVLEPLRLFDRSISLTRCNFREKNHLPASSAFLYRRARQARPRGI
jgi:hypothetical protein